MQTANEAPWSEVAEDVDRMLFRAASVHGDAPLEERLRFNELRREVFRLFPELRNGYVGDPVKAMDQTLPPRPSPRHVWLPSERRWALFAGGTAGPAINPR